MTHMRWRSGQTGHESTDHALSVDFCVGGFLACSIDRCSTKDAGKRERETLTPREREQADIGKQTCVHCTQLRKGTKNIRFFTVQCTKTRTQIHARLAGEASLLARLQALRIVYGRHPPD